MSFGWDLAEWGEQLTVIATVAPLHQPYVQFQHSPPPGAADEAVLTKVLYTKIPAKKSITCLKELEEDSEEGRDEDNGPHPIENVGALLGITSTKSIWTKTYFKEWR